MQQTTWIVAADSYRARILELKGRGQPLEELEDMVNPLARQDNSEVARSPKGRRFGTDAGLGGSSTMEYSFHPIDQAVERFADSLGDYLEKSRSDQRYQRLFVIADPKFLGILRQNLPKNVQQALEQDAAYEISGWDTRQIADFVDRKFGLH